MTGFETHALNGMRDAFTTLGSHVEIGGRIYDCVEADSTVTNNLIIGGVDEEISTVIHCAVEDFTELPKPRETAKLSRESVRRRILSVGTSQGDPEVRLTLGGVAK